MFSRATLTHPRREQDVEEITLMNSKDVFDRSDLLPDTAPWYEHRFKFKNIATEKPLVFHYTDGIEAFADIVRNPLFKNKFEWVPTLFFEDKAHTIPVAATWMNSQHAWDTQVSTSANVCIFS